MLSALDKLILVHPVIYAMAALWVVSAAVSALPAPHATSGARYVWFYSFTHLLLAKLDKLAAERGIPASTVNVTKTTVSTTGAVATEP